MCTLFDGLLQSWEPVAERVGSVTIAVIAAVAVPAASAASSAVIDAVTKVCLHSKPAAT